MICSPIIRRCLCIVCAVSLIGCAQGSRLSQPELQPISPQVREQSPLWPHKNSWQASGRFVVYLPDGDIGHTLHLVSHLGQSLRAVVMADGGVVIEDTVLTIKDQSLTAKQQAGMLARFAPALRQAFLALEEGPQRIEGGVIRRNTTVDRAYRSYAGDPLLLRMSSGQWGWVALADYQLIAGQIAPHHLYGSIGPVSWELTIQEWRTSDATNQADAK